MRAQPDYISPQDGLGVSPLYGASTWDRTEVVEMLVQAGADPELTTVWGDTPLMKAAHSGYPDTVQVGPSSLPCLSREIMEYFIIFSASDRS